MEKTSIYELTLEDLKAWLLTFGYRKGNAHKVWQWLYQKRITHFSEMENVNLNIVTLLKEHFTLNTLTNHIEQQSSDGTVKFLFKLADGHLIETVLMKQRYGYSVCVTTQVGCNIGCSFCASGLLAKKRDLETNEIVEQVMKVQRFLDKREDGEFITHVVVMGIGEPFDNFENMIKFIQIIKNQHGLSIAPTRITVSTSGLAEKIYEFTDRHLEVSLAISLHAPNDELRTKIMKINRVIPINKLMDAVKYYIAKTNRRVMFEYILLKGINDQVEHAKQLAELLSEIKKKASVNLIPYNPVNEYDQYARTEQEVVLAFYDVLKNCGISSTIRKEHGTDIDAACGQLRSKQMKLL